MKFIGQYIQGLIARFRNSVFFENVENADSDTDKFLVIGANGKLKYRTGTQVVSDIGAITDETGDITGVSITTDSGSGSRAQDSEGTADFSILGTDGVGVTNSGTTITVTSVPGEIDHDSLLNFNSNEHFTQANITTVGTIGTGVWQGTAIATAYIADDAVTFAKAQGVTPNVFDNKIPQYNHLLLILMKHLTLWQTMMVVIKNLVLVM